MSSNPYASPRAEVADIGDGAQEFQPIQLWSATGRIGRLRYLGSSTAAILLTGAAAGLVALAAGFTAALIIGGIAYVALFVFGILMMIQRSHDMNWSGWFVLLALFIPFVGLIWWFMPGSTQANRYGAPPPPNTLAVKILAGLFPVLIVLGIIAALAIPAYVDSSSSTNALELRE